ncbi:MAG: dTDP-4-dehydrorhamnose reductase [Pseudomonadota bacterium]
MRILVAGSEGQVARSLAEVGTNTAHDVICIGRPRLDITEPDSVASIVSYLHPDIIINAAAYTAVDMAEDDEENAYLVNAIGARNVALSAKTAKIPVLHLSTDYVFDGTNQSAYLEDAPVAPMSAYGKTKEAGEQLVRGALGPHLIFRTAWVHSPFGNNFVKTMLRVASKRDEIRVVADQTGTPTYANDIAKALLHVCTMIENEPDPDDVCWGTYHLVSQKSTNWADFAAEIFKHSQRRSGPSAKVIKIQSSEYPTKAHRPKNSVLSTNKLKADWNIELPDWKQGVLECVERLIVNI